MSPRSLRRSDLTVRLIPTRGHPNPCCPLSVGLWPGSPGLPFVAAAVGGREGPAPRAGAGGRGGLADPVQLCLARSVRRWTRRTEAWQSPQVGGFPSSSALSWFRYCLARAGLSSSSYGYNRDQLSPDLRRSHEVGSSSKALQCAGRTARKCRWSRVAIRVTCKRSATATTDASAAPNGKSAYLRTRSAMRSRSDVVRASSSNSPADEGVEELGLSFGPKSALGHITDLSEDRSRRTPPHSLRGSGGAAD
jgi:hypothetical protein